MEMERTRTKVDRQIGSISRLERFALMTNKSSHRFWRILRLSGLFARELVGWALMLLGLNIFRISFQYLNYSAVIEGMIATAIGFILFRSGLQLVKVAVAARAFRLDREIMAKAQPQEYSTA